jgi:hypothetical protein
MYQQLQSERLVWVKGFLGVRTRFEWMRCPSGQFFLPRAMQLWPSCACAGDVSLAVQCLTLLPSSASASSVSVCVCKVACPGCTR